jgi:hypothetical protein
MWGSSLWCAAHDSSVGWVTPEGFCLVRSTSFVEAKMSKFVLYEKQTISV